MLRLLEFLYRQRIFGLFLLLQGISIWLILSYNHRYNTYYLNSSNRLAGQVMGTVHNVESYFGLQRVNDALASENLVLRKALARKNIGLVPSSPQPDSAPYYLSIAKVINSSHRNSRNFITLRIHPEDSIQPGMGVVSAVGIVGKVKSVSTNFATVTSLLNPNLMVSGRVQSNGALCTVQWDGLNPLEAELKYVPRHLPLLKGDTVVTSGFNTVFPGGFAVGVVSFSELRKESPFYQARIRLMTDFTTLSSVYVVKVNDLAELTKIQEGLPNE